MKQFLLIIMILCTFEPILSMRKESDHQSQLALINQAAQLIEANEATKLRSFLRSSPIDFNSSEEYKLENFGGWGTSSYVLLTFAIFHRSLSSCECLLEAGADANASHSVDSALDCAISRFGDYGGDQADKNILGICKALLEHGAHITDRTLHCADANKRWRMARFIASGTLTHGQRPKSQASYAREKPMFISEFDGQPIFKTYLKAYDQEKPLFFIKCNRQQFPIFKSGFDFLIKSVGDKRIFKRGYENERFVLVKDVDPLLMRYVFACMFEGIDYEGRLAYSFRLRSEHDEKRRMKAKIKEMILEPNEEKLLRACDMPWNYQKAKKALTHCSNVDIKDCDGNTPLHLAVLCFSPTMCQLFLEHNPNLLTQNLNGETSLICAVKSALRAPMHARSKADLLEKDETQKICNAIIHKQSFYQKAMLHLLACLKNSELPVAKLLYRHRNVLLVPYLEQYTVKKLLNIKDKDGKTASDSCPFPGFPILK